MQSLVQPTQCVDIKVEGLADETMEKIRGLATNVEVNEGEMTVTLKDEEQVPLLARMIMDSGAVLREFTPRTQQLEEVFLQSIEESN